MNFKPIKTKKDYDQAMVRLEHLFDAKKGTAKGDELEILGLFIEKYEKKHFPIDLPDPIEAIRFRTEQIQ
jgi:HTH-type transcriptional regulator/antitoxin HigA